MKLFIAKLNRRLLERPRKSLIVIAGVMLATVGTGQWWHYQSQLAVPAAVVEGPAASRRAILPDRPATVTAPAALPAQVAGPMVQAAASHQPVAALKEPDSFWAAFTEAQHAVQGLTAGEAALPQNQGVRYFAANPGQELTARFLDNGVRIESGRGGSWQGTIQVTEVSRGGEAAALAEAAAPSANGNRVEYQRGSLVEWYENRKEGFEHGFTVAKNPVLQGGQDTVAEPLRIGVKFEGLKATAAQDGNGIEFQTREGMRVLSYRNLKVWDAQGTSLNAQMTAESGQLAIVVADHNAVYPVTIDPMIATLEQKLGPEVTGSGDAEDHFGASVAISGDLAVVGMPGDDTPAGDNAGSAYVFVRTASLWALQARLTASNATPGMSFGGAVSLSGTTALIGVAPPQRQPTVAGVNTISSTGSAYVFVASSGNWTQQAILSPSEQSSFDFGRSVAVAGNTALVGDPSQESVYVFLRTGTAWGLQQVLTADDGEFGDAFGTAVSLDADTAVIGAPMASDSGPILTDVDEDQTHHMGAVYVFVRTGTEWTQQDKWLGDHSFDLFGAATSVSGDSAVVGAPGADVAGSDSGSAYVYHRSGTFWSRESELMPSNAAAGAEFGTSVAAGPDRAIVGAPVANCAYVFEPAPIGTVTVMTTGSWNQVAILRVADAVGGDRLGASVSLSGDSVLIGTPDDDTRAGEDAGTAFVFVRSDLGCCEPADPYNSASWCQQARLSPGDAAVEDHFGRPVAIHGDTAAVGAQGDDTPAGTDTGAVYVFVRVDTTWSMQARLTATDGASMDNLGRSLSIYGDTLMAGAPGDDTAAGQDAGSVVVFGRTGNHWAQLTRFVAPDGAAFDGFGRSVSMQAFTAVIGAIGDDTAAGQDAGSAYVFSGFGPLWYQQAKLTATDAAPFDLFGQSVSLSGDTALVSAMGDDVDATLNAGSAYVFVRNGLIWTQQARLNGAPLAENDFFGHSVSLSGDTALIGADLADTTAGADAGAAFVFRRNGTSWSQEARLVAADGAAGDGFGRYVSLQGGTGVVTAPADDNASGVDAGGAYVFTRAGTAWTEQIKLLATNGAESDFFGSSVALFGNTALVGSEGDDGVDTLGDLAVNQGSVHVFRLWTDSGGDIVVEQPLDTPLVDGQSSIDFGLVVVGGSVEKVIYIRNTGAQNLTGIKATIDGANKGDFKVVETPPGTLAPLGLTSLTVSFAPSAVGSRVSNLKIASNDPDENPFDIQLFGSGYEAVHPEIVQEPLHKLVPLGSLVTFNASAVGQPAPKVQWLRNNANVPKATSPSLSLIATLQSVGFYQMKATNAKGTAITDPAELGVVDTTTKTLILPVGGKAVMTVTSAGNGLTHTWFKNGSPMVLSGQPSVKNATVAGANVSPNGKTLTLTDLSVSDAGTYSCLVTGPGGNTLAGATHILKVIAGHPIIIEPIDMPSGMVGVPYTFNVPFDPDPSREPASFAATGLAGTGLSINPVNGVVSGTPIKSGVFSVVFSATNIKGKYTAAPTQLFISPLYCGTAGVFNGLVDRRGSLNGGFGGTISVTVLPTAAFTGHLTLGNQVKLPFAGQLTISSGQIPGAASVSDAGFGLASAKVTVLRPTPLFPLTLEFTIDPYSGELCGTILDPWCVPQTINSFVGLADNPGHEDGTGAAASFNGPTGLVCDKAGNAYVADTRNHVIRKVTLAGVVTTFAGQPGLCGSTDGLAPEALFHSPEGMAIDADGNLYVSDTGNSTIRKITPHGEVTTLAGSGGLSGSVNGTGPAARFVCPKGLVVDKAGNVFVADAGDHTIRKITPAGVVTTFAGKSATPGALNGAAASARFNTPTGIAIDHLDRLAVADSGNHAIRAIAKNGAVTTLAGLLGVQGSSDGLLANARFNNPCGIAADPYRNIFVMDTGNHTMRRISPQGIVCTVGGRVGEPGSENGIGGEARFNEPAGLAFRPDGWHYITEKCSHAIRRGMSTYAAKPVNLLARRNPWGSDSIPTSPAGSARPATSGCYNPPASSLAGTYNVALELPNQLAGNSVYPQGNGFGTLTVKTNGVVTWVGSMADGTPTTGSTMLGGPPAFSSFVSINYIPLHFMLYNNTGSAQGWQEIMMDFRLESAQPKTQLSDVLIDGVLDWMKIPQSPAVVFNYAGGIPLHVQTTLGERNLPPGTNEVVLGFGAPPENAQLSFAEGGLDPDFSQLFTISTKNVATAAGTNTNQVKMPGLNAATGKFGGTFVLMDPNPIPGAAPAELKRTPAFNGVLMRRLGRGVGYFLLNSLPSAGPPPTTLAKSPILSGQVILERPDVHDD